MSTAAEGEIYTEDKTKKMGKVYETFVNCRNFNFLTLGKDSFALFFNDVIDMAICL